MTEAGENKTLEEWISFAEQNDIQTPHYSEGEIIYDLQAGKAGLLINSSRAIYLWTPTEGGDAAPSCANEEINRTNILRFYVSDKPYLVTLDGKQF